MKNIRGSKKVNAWGEGIKGKEHADGNGKGGRR